MTSRGERFVSRIGVGLGWLGEVEEREGVLLITKALNELVMVTFGRAWTLRKTEGELK